MEELLSVALSMQKKLSHFNFKEPVEYVYSPLDYDWYGYKSYITKFAPQKAKALFIGMNPGPFGMAQTGIPFGDTIMVKKWMKISGKININSKIKILEINNEILIDVYPIQNNVVLVKIYDQIFSLNLGKENKISKLIVE